MDKKAIAVDAMIDVVASAMLACLSFWWFEIPIAAASVATISLLIASSWFVLDHLSDKPLKTALLNAAATLCGSVVGGLLFAMA